MEYEEIIEAIGGEAADLPPDVAERAAQAVLQTLAERLPRGEARHILAELPAELKPWVYTETDAEGFGIDEFLERVAKREGTDIETALRHARAVFAALCCALDAERGGAPRWRPACRGPSSRWWLEAQAAVPGDPMPADEFWRRVGQRLGLDQTAARRACTEAVGWRRGSPRAWSRTWRPGSTRCCTRRCGAALPRRARPRGGCRWRSSCAGWPGRESADVDEAGLVDVVFEHVRAVFATLAEAVDAEEWFDMIAELPAEYSGLIPERPA